MKSKRFATVILALVTLMSLVGCGGGARDQSADMSDHALVGIWEWDDNRIWQYNFSPDGTGTFGYPDELRRFTWSIPEEGHLRISVQGLMGAENWDYIIEGDRLTLSDRQPTGDVYTYTRAGAASGDGASAEVNPDLVDTWNWAENPSWQEVLRDDGTGTRGFPGELEHFTWSTPRPGHLHIDIDGVLEFWGYTFVEDILVLENLQDPDELYLFRRDGAQIDLVGTWVWRDDAEWRYVIHADGTGTRGTPDTLQSFTWTMPVPGYVKMDAGGLPDEWRYVVDGDALVLESVQIPDVVHVFTRAN